MRTFTAAILALSVLGGAARADIILDLNGGTAFGIGKDAQPASLSISRRLTGNSYALGTVPDPLPLIRKYTAVYAQGGRLCSISGRVENLRPWVLDGEVDIIRDELVRLHGAEASMLRTADGKTASWAWAAKGDLTSIRLETLLDKGAANLQVTISFVEPDQCERADIGTIAIQ